MQVGAAEGGSCSKVGFGARGTALAGQDAPLASETAVRMKVLKAPIFDGEARFKTRRATSQRFQQIAWRNLSRSSGSELGASSGRESETEKPRAAGIDVDVPIARPVGRGSGGEVGLESYGVGCLTVPIGPLPNRQHGDSKGRGRSGGRGKGRGRSRSS